jgi:hypothetical protein
MTRIRFAGGTSIKTTSNNLIGRLGSVDSLSSIVDIHTLITLLSRTNLNYPSTNTINNSNDNASRKSAQLNTIHRMFTKTIYRNNRRYCNLEVILAEKSVKI